MKMIENGSQKTLFPEVEAVEEKVKLTADDLRTKIRYRFAGDGFVVLDEVASGTAMYATSHVDMVVFGMWPSKGLLRSAFELKVDRGDFLKEITNPDKNLWAHECFHEFWYVAPKGVIKSADEVPQNCGWMVPRGNTTAIVKAAQRKENPTLDDLLLASFMRSLSKEREQIIETTKDIIFKTDDYIKELKIIYNGVELFLAKKNESLPYRIKSPEDILERLEKATVEKEKEVEREHILGALDDFQENIFSMFKIFSQLAHVGLLERDKLGKFVIEHFGGTDDLAYETACVKKGRNVPGYRKNADANVRVFYEAIAKCAKDVLELPGEEKK